MRVMHINCTYDQGSTGKIIMDISNADLDNEYFFVYETGPKSNSNSNRYRMTSSFIQKCYYLYARITGLKHSTGVIPTAKMFLWMRKINPDVVHVHCPYINTIHVPLLISYLKIKRIPTVITNHSEYFYTGNCPHSYDCMKFQTGCGDCNYAFDYFRPYLFDRTAYEWKKMKNAFHGADNIYMVAVSNWVYNRMNLSPICDGIKKEVILNGVDTNIFNYIENPTKISGLPEKYILHVTSSFSDSEDDLKGGRFVIELAKRMPDISFVICGMCNVDKNIMPTNIILKGTVSDKEELAEYYSAAKLTLITSKRETYGMTCSESLCCGTPVVGFKAGGPESISIDEYSCFVEYANVYLLENAINQWMETEYNKNSVSKLAISKYNNTKMVEEYNCLYKKING